MPIFPIKELRDIPSQHGTIPSDWCQALCPFAETYPVKMETCPHLLKPRIHSYKQMQSVAKKTSISRSWPPQSMGTSRYKAFSTYIMQGDFTLLPPATVSTVETVNASQLLYNPSALTTDWPYTRKELSCRISPSRPGIWSLFLCAFFQFQHVLIKIRHKQSVLNNTVLFKFGLSMELGNFCGHLTRIL